MPRWCLFDSLLALARRGGGGDVRGLSTLSTDGPPPRTHANLPLWSHTWCASVALAQHNLVAGSLCGTGTVVLISKHDFRAMGLLVAMTSTREIAMT
jgi:hypothetical protein